MKNNCYCCCLLCWQMNLVGKSLMHLSCKLNWSRIAIIVCFAMQSLPAHVMPRFHVLSTAVMQVEHLLPENRTYMPDYSQL